ncbi:hypothetical protein [Pseudoalteromonas distincta]|uniref:hypothetical protein n=1 Tax=Pseudoalteromonas distincta TaxID=77608 RepID=UPI0032E2403A
MSLQNRVTPSGRLESTSARGAWLGNRGILHNKDKKIVSPWKHQAWVTCKLNYKGIKRDIFSPNKYSELFFIDEVTALSAGHRPCGGCRKVRYNEFKLAWCNANLDNAVNNISITTIDKKLHAERAIRGGEKVTYNEVFEKLPAGTFISINTVPHLIWDNKIYPWTHYGYNKPISAIPLNKIVEVLTPVSIVIMFKKGFIPQVHPSICNESI